MGLRDCSRALVESASLKFVVNKICVVDMLGYGEPTGNERRRGGRETFTTRSMTRDVLVSPSLG